MARMRRVYSVQRQLLAKAREAALTAIQTYNNPQVQFKSETFIVLMMVAWTYLLHAYYRKEGIEYRYYEMRNKRRRFKRTADGSYRHWDLNHCLDCDKCPLDSPTRQNVRFLLGVRHEIEHRVPPQLDDYLSARYQACCVNFNDYMKRLFGDRYAVDASLRYSIQFVHLSPDQVVVDSREEIPANVQSYIARFDEALAADELNDHRFSLRFLFARRMVGKPGQADHVVEFIPADSPLADQINKQYVVIKEQERPKYLPKRIVSMMQGEGFPRFNMHCHTQLWKAIDAKNPGKGFGTMVADGHWYWYERWVQLVREHCAENPSRYKYPMPRRRLRGSGDTTE